MKKLITITVALFLITTSFGQYFDGVLIDGKLELFVDKFKAKGFTAKNENGVAILTGKVALKDVQIFVFTTPITKLVWKITVYMPYQYTWYGIKSEYFSFLDIFKEKYGTPKESFASFLNPYYDGDGYEVSAIKTDKCLYESLWFDVSNMNISLSISKYMQIKILYENAKNADVFQKEMKQKNQNAF
jgi:hypothetical protein